jgi:hypothetical protein
VEQDHWLKFTAQRLGVEEAALRRSLTSLAPITSPRLQPGRRLINLEKGLLKWILQYPGAVSTGELEEWAGEFEDPELRGIMALIIRCYREHDRLDHGLLIQQVEAEPLRQQICALALGEEEFCGLAEDWRRNFRIRQLKKASQALKERLATAATGEADLLALLAQRQEIDRQLENLKVWSTTKGEDG